MTEYVVCISCREILGKHRPFFARMHLKEYPTHDGFMIVNTIKEIITPRME
jgi:hypothetical protein